MVRHRRLLVPQHQPVCPAPALLVFQSAPDVLELGVQLAPVSQRVMVQGDAPE